MTWLIYIIFEWHHNLFCFFRSCIYYHLYFIEAYLGPKAATVDGYEKTFGINYLGHFYLTYLLHDLLMKSAPARIINLSSNSYVKGKLDFDDLSLVNYEMFEAYTRSKMAIMHFTVEAHRMWFPDAIMAFSVHPGIQFSVIFRYKIFFNTPCTVDPDMIARSAMSICTR